MTKLWSVLDRIRRNHFRDHFPKIKHDKCMHCQKELNTHLISCGYSCFGTEIAIMNPERDFCYKSENNR